MPTKRSRDPDPLALVRGGGLVRLREFEEAGVPKARVLRLCDSGALERVGRGLYAAADREVSDVEALVQVAKRVPQGVVCLLSALRYHDLTEQNPPKVWLAIARKARRPTLEWPPLEIVWWSEPTLTFGVERHRSEGTDISITSAPKTVADTIKYRNKIGVDVAVQAVRDYRRRRLSMDALFAAARLCRVEKVLRGYLEVMQ